jgi:hypothetical protein
MGSSAMTIDPILAWLIAGLITILVIMVGFFGSKIYEKISLISDFVAGQQEINRQNKEEHSRIFMLLDEHRDKLDEHQEQINTLSLVELHCKYNPFKEQVKEPVKERGDK